MHVLCSHGGVKLSLFLDMMVNCDVYNFVVYETWLFLVLVFLFTCWFTENKKEQSHVSFTAKLSCHHHLIIRVHHHMYS